MLAAFLDKYVPLPSAVEMEARYKLLIKLRKLANEVSEHLLIHEGGLTLEMARMCGVHVRAFGSYMMNVGSPGTDVDVLIVCSSHIPNRARFAQEMVKRLLADTDDVKNLLDIPGAWVPITKLEMRGIHIDLLTARLNAVVVGGQFDIFDNVHLVGADVQSVRAVNGARTTESFFRLVPNVSVFCLVLRFVKDFAKSNLIYSNMLGFWSGVSIALLVAKLCRTHSAHDTAEYILQRFFLYYNKYPWPDPVCINEDAFYRPPLEVLTSLDDIPWSPTPKSLMPVLTPEIPVMNSTYNITAPTRELICSALKRAASFVEKFLDLSVSVSVSGSVSASSSRSASASASCLMSEWKLWEQLRSRVTFFHEDAKFKRFIEVRISSHKSSMRGWQGWTETRLRRLNELSKIGISLYPYCGHFVEKYDTKNSADCKHQKNIAKRLRKYKKTRYTNSKNNVTPTTTTTTPTTTSASELNTVVIYYYFGALMNSPTSMSKSHHMTYVAPETSLSSSSSSSLVFSSKKSSDSSSSSSSSSSTQIFAGDIKDSSMSTISASSSDTASTQTPTTPNFDITEFIDKFIEHVETYEHRTADQTIYVQTLTRSKLPSWCLSA